MLFRTTAPLNFSGGNPFSSVGGGGPISVGGLNAPAYPFNGPSVGGGGGSTVQHWTRSIVSAVVVAVIAGAILRKMK